MKNATTAVIATVTIALSPAAQEVPPGESAVDLVVQRLTDESPAKAEAAVRSLIRGGPSSAKVLRAALERCEDPAFVERARRALALCEVDAEVDHGVKVGLFADREKVAPGDGVRFTARLCNVSDEEVVLFTGMSYSGSVFENGLALQRVEESGATQARFGSVGFCGTGAYPLTVKLPPWSFREFSCTATFLSGPSGNHMIPCEGPRLVSDYVFLELGDDPSKVRIRLRHAVRLDGVGGMARPEDDPDWEGEVVSNEIVLRLEDG